MVYFLLPVSRTKSRESTRLPKKFTRRSYRKLVTPANGRDPVPSIPSRCPTFSHSAVRLEAARADRPSGRNHQAQSANRGNKPHRISPGGPKSARRAPAPGTVRQTIARRPRSTANPFTRAPAFRQPKIAIAKAETSQQIL